MIEDAGNSSASEAAEAASSSNDPTLPTSPWSDPIKVSEFAHKFKNSSFVDGSAFVFRKFKEVDLNGTLERWMCLDEETMDSLKRTMDPKNLFCGDEEVDSTIIPEIDLWESLNLRRQDLNKKVPWHAAALKVVRVGAFKVNLTQPRLPEPTPRTLKGSPVVGIEAVLVVSFLLPSASGPYFKNLIGQFAVLGRTPLSQLVRRFKCDNDEARPGDFSEQPFAREDVKPLKEVLPGFALFIEGTFYTNNWDYPSVIQEWAANRKLGEYSVKNIEGVTFSELTLSLGKPYVYIHSGDCQHHVIFNDLRILSMLRDDGDSEHYPMLLGSYVHNTVRTLCQLCGKRAAQWAVKDHPKLPHDPFFLCFGCNNHINYTNGVKRYDFKLFSYADWGLI